MLKDNCQETPELALPKHTKHPTGIFETRKTLLLIGKQKHRTKIAQFSKPNTENLSCYQNAVFLLKTSNPSHGDSLVESNFFSRKVSEYLEKYKVTLQRSLALER